MLPLKLNDIGKHDLLNMETFLEAFLVDCTVATATIVPLYNAHLLQTSAAFAAEGVANFANTYNNNKIHYVQQQ